MRLFIINLSRAPLRMAQISARLSALGLAYERIEALDRLAIPEAALRAEFGHTRRSRRLPATPGDMACSLTHQRLWRRIAQGGEPVMVLEDDAWLSDGLKAWASGRAEAVMRAHDLDLLRLEYWPSDPPSRRVLLGTQLAQEGWGRLYRLRGSAFGSCAYVMTPQAAGRLLTSFPEMEVPVDHHLSGERAGMGWRLLRIGFVDPAPVLHNVDELGSDMRSERAERGIDQANWAGLAKLAKRRIAWRHRWLVASKQAERVQLSFDGVPPGGHSQ